jgi:hypothetical protein
LERLSLRVLLVFEEPSPILTVNERRSLRCLHPDDTSQSLALVNQAWEGSYPEIQPAIATVTVRDILFVVFLF